MTEIKLNHAKPYYIDRDNKSLTKSYDQYKFVFFYLKNLEDLC